MGKLYVCKFDATKVKRRTVNDASFVLLAYSQGKLWLIECV